MSETAHGKTKESVMDKVYAAYGRAMSESERLEQCIVSILSGRDSRFPEQISRQRYAFFFDRTVNKFFERLENALFDRVPMKNDIDKRLRDALVKRNWLAHQYWWDRSTERDSPGGRKMMIDELDRLYELFADLKQYFIEYIKL